VVEQERPPHAPAASVALAAAEVVAALGGAPAKRLPGGIRRLVDDGVPLTGMVTATLELYDDATAGSVVWDEIDVLMPDETGAFVTTLGDSDPLDGVDFEQPLWLEVTPSGQAALSPRLPLAAAPYAFALVGGVPASDPNPLPSTSSPSTVTHAADGNAKTVTTAERVVRIRTDGGTASNWYLCEINVAGGEQEGMEVAVVLAEDEGSGERPLLRRYNSSDCNGLGSSNILYNGSTQFVFGGDALFCKYFDGLLLNGTGGWLCTSD